MSQLPTIIAVAIQKGGVGKTTTAVNLAVSFAAKGKETLVVDVDPQSNATVMLGHDVAKIYQNYASQSVFQVFASATTGLTDVIVPTIFPHVDLAPGNEALKGLEGVLPQVMGRELILREEIDAMNVQGKRYDYIIIDTPPTDGIAVSLALCAADKVLIPLAAEDLPVLGMTQINNSIERAKKFFNADLRQRIVMTMVDTQQHHTKPIIDETRERYGSLVYDTIIPEQAEMKRPIQSGGAVVVYAPKSTGAVAYQALAEEVLLG